jgi:hypothetical protein
LQAAQEGGVMETEPKRNPGGRKPGKQLSKAFRMMMRPEERELLELLAAQEYGGNQAEAMRDALLKAAKAAGIERPR